MRFPWIRFHSSLPNWCERAFGPAMDWMCNAYVCTQRSYMDGFAVCACEYTVHYYILYCPWWIFGKWMCASECCAFLFEHVSRVVYIIHRPMSQTLTHSHRQPTQTQMRNPITYEHKHKRAPAWWHCVREYIVKNVMGGYKQFEASPFSFIPSATDSVAFIHNRFFHVCVCQGEEKGFSGQLIFVKRQSGSRSHHSNRQTRQKQETSTDPSSQRHMHSHIHTHYSYKQQFQRALLRFQQQTRMFLLLSVNKAARLADGTPKNHRYTTKFAFHSSVAYVRTLPSVCVHSMRACLRVGAMYTPKFPDANILWPLYTYISAYLYKFWGTEHSVTHFDSIALK